MPEKLGGGGNIQENYDPNTGKYATDGIPNKYYDNPKENILGSLGIEEELDNAIENAIGPSMMLQEHKESIKEMCNSLPESKYKDVLIDYIKKSRKAINIGNYAISEYGNGRIKLEYDVINNKDLKTFTHEIGHAINDMHKGNRIGELSSFFRDENGKTIVEHIFSDFEKNGSKLLLDYKNYEESILKEEFQKNGFVYKTEKERKLAFETRKENKKKEYQDKIGEIISQFQQYSKGKSQEELYHDNYALGLEAEYQSLRADMAELDEKNFIPEKLPKKELELKEKVLTEKIKNKYMNISDAVSSMGIKGGLCNVGHDPLYWQSRDVIADEFFANCFNSLVTNNSEEIEMYEKYFPNAFQTVKKALKDINNKIEGENLYGKLGL